MKYSSSEVYAGRLIDGEMKSIPLWGGKLPTVASHWDNLTDLPVVVHGDISSEPDRCALHTDGACLSDGDKPLGNGGGTRSNCPSLYDGERRHNYEWQPLCPTLMEHIGTGGGNLPLVVHEGVLHSGKRDRQTAT